MSTPATLQARNQECAHRINGEALRDPQSPFAGKFVGIFDGQVVTVADGPDAAIRQLQALGIDLLQALCFEAGIDYDEVVEIWGLW